MVVVEGGGERRVGVGVMGGWNDHTMSEKPSQWQNVVECWSISWWMQNEKFLQQLIITIIIAFKGAFWNFLQSSWCAANCLQHVCSSGQGTTVWKSCATHWAPITCNMLCATWYEETAIEFDRVEITFILTLLNLTELKLHLFSRYWIWQSWNYIYFNVIEFDRVEITFIVVLLSLTELKLHLF